MYVDPQVILQKYVFPLKALLTLILRTKTLLYLHFNGSAA